MKYPGWITLTSQLSKVNIYFLNVKKITIENFKVSLILKHQSIPSGVKSLTITIPAANYNIK
jgi:hypothetical protein